MVKWEKVCLGQSAVKDLRERDFHLILVTHECYQLRQRAPAKGFDKYNFVGLCLHPRGLRKLRAITHISHSFSPLQRLILLRKNLWATTRFFYVGFDMKA